MRKGAMLLAIVMLASAPTVAFAAKKAPPAPTKWDTTPANSNDNTARFFQAMGKMWTPVAAPAAAPAKAKKVKTAKAKPAKKA
jgi:hypothetical protein